MKDIVRWKLSRLRSGRQPRTLDLFAGCGGFSLGAQLAGCRILGGIEVDPTASASHARNFHSLLDSDSRKAHARPRDITRVDPIRLVGEFCPTTAEPAREVDVLVGGPPCQAFARVGRAKLREIMEHPRAFLQDKRSGLYAHYLRFVEALRPIVVVIENVPDVLNYGGLNVFETVAIALEELGYECRYSLLNAVHYGVPQMRTRCFLLAVSREAEVAPTPPLGTHFHQLPPGYQGTADVALKSLTLFEPSHFVAAKTPLRNARRAVTAREAIGDLPQIKEHLAGKLRKTAQRLNKPVALPLPANLSAFATLMRHWPGFETDGYTYDHVIRFLPRDYKIFARMLPGDQYPDAHALAIRMRDEAVLREQRRIGRHIEPGSALYRALTKQYVPPYDPGKFPNKWRKMAAEEPARTIMAHIGKDSYSHIHYDDDQARTISVREAARLQSFPDGFRFEGTMNPAFRQIGNAVPPLLARAVISRVLDLLLDRSTPLSTDLAVQERLQEVEANEPVESSR